MLEAGIGLDPWSAFHEVVSQRSGLSFGRIAQVTGLVLILTSRVLLSVKPGIATVLNMLLIGPWVDLVRPFVDVTDGFGPGVIQFLVAIGILGVGTAVYIGASLGAGPPDGLAMGLSRRMDKSLRASRIGVEVVVLVLAVVLGGSIGWGTLIFALLMGPTMQASLRLFRVSYDPSPAYQRYGEHPPHTGGVR